MASALETTAGSPTRESQFIQRQLDVTRWHVRLVELGAAGVAWLAAVVGYLTTVAIIDHWLMPLGIVGRSLAFFILVGGTAAFAVRVVWPLVRRQINPIYAARTIEESSPSLKNSLINFLLLRKDAAGVKEAVLVAVEQRAAADIAQVPVDLAVDRTKLIRLGYVLLGVLAVFGLYKIRSPKDPFQSWARVLAPWAGIERPSRVVVRDIEPGDVRVYHGKSLTISCAVTGLRTKEKVQVIYSSLDGQIVEQALPLAATAGGTRYEAELPPRESGSRPSAGVQQDLVYRIVAGDAVSRDFQVTVVASPVMTVERVTYDFPSYTRKAAETITGQGDVQALEGTRVTIHAQANVPIASGGLELDPPVDGKGNPTVTVPLVIEGQSARATFTLQLKPDRVTPLHTRYQLRFVTAVGERNEQPVVHRIDVTPDLPPEIEWLTPNRPRVEVPVDGSQLCELRGVDPDFGLSSVKLIGSRGEKKVLEKSLLASGNSPRQTNARLEFRPAEFSLEEGDEIVVIGVAEDNRHAPVRDVAEPNTAQTPGVVFKIVAPKKAATPPERKPNDPNNPQQPKKPDEPQANKKPQDGNGADEQRPDKKPDDKPGADEPMKNENQPQPKEQPEQKSKNGGKGEDEQPMAGEEENGGKGGGGGGQSGGSGDDQKQGSGGSEGKSGGGNSGSKSSDQKSEGGSAGGKSGRGSDGSAADDGQSSGDGSDSQQKGGGKSQTGSKSGNKGEAGDDNQGGDAGNDREPAEGSDDNGGGRSSGGGKAGSNSSNAKPHDGDVFQKVLDQLKEKPKNGAQGKKINERPAGDQQPGAEGAQRDDNAQPPSGSKGNGNTQQSKSSGGKNPAGENPGGQQETGAKPNGNPANSKENPQNSGQPQEGAGKNDGGPSNGGKNDPAAGKKNAPPGGDSPENAAGKKNDPQNDGSGANKKPNLPDQRHGEGKNDQGNSGSSGAPQKNPQESPMKKPGEGQTGEKKEPGAGDNGQSGAGSNSDDKTGNGPADGQNQDKPKNGSPDNNKPEQGEPSTPSQSKKQSDSQGGESGTHSGGGKKGGGQSAKQAGNDSAGNTSPGDQGNGAAPEQGEGDTGSQAGKQQTAPDKTGTSGEQPGVGSASRPGESGGKNPPGTSNESGKGTGSEKEPNSNSGGDSTGPGKKGPVQGGGQPDERTGGATHSGGSVPDSEAANMEYARKATDLVIDHLKQQEHNPDPDLLKQLGLTKDELQAFLRRWEQMKQNGQQNPNEQRELDESLRSLGLRPPKEAKRTGGVADDKTRDVRDAGGRTSPPNRYREQFDAFRKGIGRPAK